MTTLTDKVSIEKMDEAVKILQEIMTAVQRYNELFKTFTVQEKHLAGGIVFRIRNVWNDFNMVGVMADRELARDMIETLAVFFNQPQKFGGIQNNSKIEVAKSEPDDLKN